MKNTDGILTIIIIKIAIFLYGLVTWIVNLIQFFNCDFEAPYRQEVIKAVGVFIPPLNMITVWF